MDSCGQVKSELNSLDKTPNKAQKNSPVYSGGSGGKGSGFKKKKGK